MKIVKSVAELRALPESRSVGFVPTMGALHDGHLSLVRKARAENERVVVSIFVNPAQFNDPEDLRRYPRPIEKDLAMLARENTDVAFLPIHDEIYGDRFRFEVREKEFTKMLCGATRPGHFEGVLTVVMKLFCLVRPTRAYFGEKDFQQLSLIRDMAKSFFLGVDVIGVPTVREADGGGMIRRILRHKSKGREPPPRLYQIIKTAADAGVARRELSTLGFRVDYVEDVAGRRFAAAFLGSVRLIDNVEL